MRNILCEKPTDPPGGRNLAFIEFVGKNNFKGKEVVDVGCGFGWLEYRMASLAKSIVAIDIDDKNIKLASKYVKNKNVSFVKASALELPIKTNSIDIVISSEMLEHLPVGTEEIFFKEVHRVLKDNGYFYITTPFKNFWSVIFDPAWWLIKHRHYSIKDLKKMAEKSGLKMIKYKVGGKWWSLIGLMNMYVSKWVFRRKRFWNEFFNQKEKEEFLKKTGKMNVFVAFKKDLLLP